MIVKAFLLLLSLLLINSFFSLSHSLYSRYANDDLFNGKLQMIFFKIDLNYYNDEAMKSTINFHERGENSVQRM